MKEPCWKRGPPKIWKVREGLTKCTTTNTSNSARKLKNFESATLSLYIIPKTHTHVHVLASSMTDGLDRIAFEKSPRILRFITWKNSTVPPWQPPLPETDSSDSSPELSSTIIDLKPVALSESEKAWKESRRQRVTFLRRMWIEIYLYYELVVCNESSLLICLGYFCSFWFTLCLRFLSFGLQKNTFF